jgi:alpha-glucoside transport system permease protein
VTGIAAPRQRGGPKVAAGALVLGLPFILLVVASLLVRPWDPQDTGLLTGIVQRLLAATIGVGGLTGAVRAFRTPGANALRRGSRMVLAAAMTAIVWWLYLERDGVRSAVHSVVIAVILSVTLFIAANRWLDQSTRAWARFTGISGAALGTILAAILYGNAAIGLFIGTVGSRVDRGVWLIPVLGVLGGAYGLALGATTGRVRLLVGCLGGAGLGALVGGFLRTGSQPSIAPFMLVLSVAGVALAFAGLAALRGRAVGRGLVTGAAWGWLLGSFGFPELGAGSPIQAIVGTVGVGALLGLRLGLVPDLDIGVRLRMESRIRTIIFLAPALTFLSAALVVPTIRTIYLSFLEGGAGGFVGLDNFRFIFGQPSFYNVQAWRSIFSSTEFLLFALGLTAALVLAVRQRRAIDGIVPPRLVLGASAGLVLLVGTWLDRAGLLDPDSAAWPIMAVLAIAGTAIVLVDYLRRNVGNSGLSGPGGAALAAAALFLAFAVFSTLRGTLFNNLWWVVLVTCASAGLGLAIAALADGARAESAAKSIIFMPMALSFVGAGIIWRFMYLARPENRPQTGVINSIWVGLGNIALSDRAPTAAGVMIGVAALLVVISVFALRQGSLGTGWTLGFLAMGAVGLGYRFLAGTGLAGVQIVDGVAVTAPLFFISGTQQFGSYNNVFIMIPFIWVYTGFAMVIFSAAIKGVPADLLEAGRVDGASEAQAFWRIVLPQIRPTIGVVLTTIIVVVMKVFDIVKVMTNGNFGTQVLANEMWNRAFIDGNFGVGSAVATVLFLAVLPVMYANIRRMQKEAA